MLKTWRQLALVFAMVLASVLIGCERKQKVIDVETPIGGVEVERSDSDASVDVEVGKKPS